MPVRDPINLVRALVGAELSGQGLSVDEVLRRGHVVTISREYGSGGLEVAKILEERLGVNVFDREILDAVAKDAKVDRYLMERLDEKVRSALDDWAYTTITGKSAFKEDYRRHLVNVIMGIARTGGIIVGRGAHLILHPETAFRVRITGSVEKCAQRIAEKKGISLEEAENQVRQVNKERSDFVRSLYRVEDRDHSRFDLVLNSDRYTPDQMGELILLAMTAAGFAVEKKTQA